MQFNIQKLRNTGIIKVNKFLDLKELETFKKILLKQLNAQNKRSVLMSNNYKNLFIKILKFKKNKFIDDLKFLQLAKKKNLSKLAENYFEKKTKLTMIDGYLSKKVKTALYLGIQIKPIKEKFLQRGFLNKIFIILITYF